MSDYSELKRLASLAKNWSGEIGEDDWYTACCFDKPKFSVLDAEFIAKCEPGSVLALIAEVEGLRAQHGRDSAELRSLCQARDYARKERDQLKVDNEALRKDAERYRWLREKVGVDLIFGDYNPWLLSCNTDMTDLEKKTTDEAIDAAMTKVAKP